MQNSEITIPIGSIGLSGELQMAPKGPLVIFAHGSGSSRFSPRNRFVASVIYEAGIGTLLIDLLTPAEDGHRERVFDIPLLAGRLVAATRWARER